MKNKSFRKFFYRIASALCAVVLVMGLAPAAQAEDYSDVSAPSKNINRPSYTTNSNGDRIRSYLFANEEGGITRVEYFGLDEVVCEDFDSDFRYVPGSRYILDLDLPQWGGFYAGKQYNFVIYGDSNPQESDSKEVIRVMKYDKNWKRQGYASVYGANTTVPFRLGNLRCTESGGNLYIHTCHEMYQSSDGLNHQANMRIVVRESDMLVLKTNCTIGKYPDYVSHSFNQFILADQSGNIVTADLGDGYPRALVLHRITGGPENERFAGSAQTETFSGAIGDNYTGVMPGGLAETSSGYLMSYTQGGVVKLAYIAKNDFSQSSGNELQYRQVAKYDTSLSFHVSYPVLVPIGMNGGYILWTSWESDPNGWDVGNRKVYYTTYDAAGQTGTVQSAPGALSDCQPIVYNGQVVWYTTEDQAPVFYVLDDSGLKTCQAVGPQNAAKPLTSIGPAVSGAAAPATPSAPSTSTAPSTSGTPAAPSGTTGFRDVSASHWANADIAACAVRGVVTGYNDGRFGPEDTVTSAQFIAMLTRTFYAEQVDAVKTAAGQPWYYSNAKVAGDIGVAENLKAIDESPMNRYEMAAAIFSVMSDKGIISQVSTTELTLSLAKMKDIDNIYDNQGYADAIGHCAALGVITGMSDGTFSGNQTMTRAQACAVIVRMMELING